MFLSTVFLASVFAFLSTVSAQIGQAQLAELAASNGGVIKLNPTLFNTLTSPNRNWSAAIQLTALSPQFRCSPCLEFGPNFKAVAKAWQKIDPSVRDYHFFGTLDFQDGQEIFQRLGLNSAPVLIFYPATDGPVLRPKEKRVEFQYDFNSHGFGAEALADDLSRHTPARIPYVPPFNYQPYIFAFMTILSLSITVRFAWIYLSEILMSRWTWAVIVIFTSLTMTGGYMYVQIRGMPYTSGSSMIAGGYQTQYGIETSIVGAVYGLLGSCYLALILLVPGIPSAGRQRISVYLWTAIIFVLFSILLSLFRLKNGGYPFKLLI